MGTILINEDSFRFSRAVYGILALVALLLNNFWIILGTGILMGMGVISINYNLFYQLHSLFLQRFLTKRPSLPAKDLNNVRVICKDLNEVRFGCLVGATFLFLAFLLFYFWKLTTLAWILAGLVILLSLLAGLTGVCVGSLMYVFLKKILKIKKI